MPAWVGEQQKVGGSLLGELGALPLPLLGVGWQDLCLWEATWGPTGNQQEQATLPCPPAEMGQDTWTPTHTCVHHQEKAKGQESSTLAQALFLPEESWEALELNIQVKRLQQQWSLFGKSLGAHVPPAPVSAPR